MNTTVRCAEAAWWGRRLGTHAGWLLVAPVAAAVLAGGCEHAPAPATPTVVEEAPYRVTDSGLLHVRPDIVPLLKFAKATESPVNAEIQGVGEIDFAPGALTALRIPFDGIIESVEVSAGMKVAADDVLARIRSRELSKMRADVRRIASELTGQYDALHRVQDLVQSEAVSSRRLVELQAKIGSLEAERNGTLIALRAARTTAEGEDLFELRSPRDGQVIERVIDPGEQADDPENQPAFIIADPTLLIVRAYFPERDAPLLKEGFACRIEIPALGELPLGGRVMSVVRSIDRERRTVGVTCSFDAPTTAVRAHMLARVTVAVQGEPAVVVPREAVLLRRDTRVALVRRGPDELERRPVIVGASLDGRVVIVSGIREGEEVVAEGAVLLDGELDRLL